VAPPTDSEAVKPEMVQKTWSMLPKSCAANVLARHRQVSARPANLLLARKPGNHV
jgi:hypothetical protein